MTAPLLCASGLTKRFGGLTAVDSVDFAVEEGAIVGLIGPNGAGKTTVFNLISRFYEPTAGKISFEGRDLLSFPPHRVVGLGIARTFQNLGLFPYLSVRDNLLVGGHVRLRSSVLSLALGVGRGRREEGATAKAAEEMLAAFGMEGLSALPASLLPYGTQKAVELLRALMARPRLLLLDEPVAGMNATETQAMAHLIRRIRDERGITVLLVEHDMSLVMEVCEHIVVLDFGRKIAEGPPREIQSNPRVIEAYLGEEADRARV
ncbi:MAG: ABC transporter ATP-binding protein [Candidatus Acetothermia bacterium]|jgi:ABC-type branched-subunit amino acid transport system ATPase component|nr:ABC transporter ATP-binding protein [Candidatus Acetothermia bacterium]